MAMVRTKRELFRDIIKSMKGRAEKKSDFNWPELDTYCGCCQLSTGIFIRCVFTLVVTIVFIAFNALMLKHLLELKPIVHGASVEVNDTFISVNRTFTREEVMKLLPMYKAIIAYYIFWLSYKSIHVIVLVWTFLAYLKKYNQMLKVLFYSSLPNFVLDIFVSIVAIILTNNNEFLRILLCICLLFEGYNILAIDSEYKRVTGKLKPRYRDMESEPGTPVSHTISPSLRESYTYNQQHCSTCTCNSNGRLDHSYRAISTQSLPDSMNDAPIMKKQIDEYEVNYAITGVLNMGNVEAVRINPTVRPNTLDLKPNAEKEEVKVTDEPVIYDTNQLNVGTSPVIEYG